MEQENEVVGSMFLSLIHTACSPDHNSCIQCGFHREGSALSGALEVLDVGGLHLLMSNS